MSLASRIVFKFPSIRALEEHAKQTAEQRDELRRQIDELAGQRDALERERDELAVHCERLNREAGEARERERAVVAERAQVLRDRDNLERERNELRGHCERLETDLAQRGEAEETLKAQLVSLEQLHQEFVERAVRMIGSEALAGQMQRDWDERAQQNAMHSPIAGARIGTSRSTRPRASRTSASTSPTIWKTSARV
jgi:chromosome segregation ATPase